MGSAKNRHPTVDADFMLKPRRVAEALQLPLTLCRNSLQPDRFRSALNGGPLFVVAAWGKSERDRSERCGHALVSTNKTNVASIK
jgi:hypothetical protein